MARTYNSAKSAAVGLAANLTRRAIALLGSQEKVAVALGTRQSVVSRYLYGRQPSARVIEQLLRITRCAVMDRERVIVWTPRPPATKEPRT